MTILELYNRYVTTLERINVFLMRRDYHNLRLLYLERLAAKYEDALMQRMKVIR